MQINDSLIQSYLEAENKRAFAGRICWDKTDALHIPGTVNVQNNGQITCLNGGTVKFEVNHTVCSILMFHEAHCKDSCFAIIIIDLESILLLASSWLSLDFSRHAVVKAENKFNSSFKLIEC